SIDGLVLNRDRLIAVAKDHFQIVQRALGQTSGAQGVDESIAQLITGGFEFDGRDIDGLEGLTRTWAAVDAAVQGMKAAGRKRGGRGTQHNKGGRPHATTFTIRFGTTMIRFGALPSNDRTTSGIARTALSTTERSASFANRCVARSLPFTCTAMVTTSSRTSS